MKVYLLTTAYERENSHIHGIFSSVELAQKHLSYALWVKADDGSFYDGQERAGFTAIREFTVDTPSLQVV